MTVRQAYALALLRRARQDEPATDDGVVSDWTYYDPEISVAYIHWNTARSLARLRLVEISDVDPDNGSSITLTNKAATWASE